MSRTIRNPYTGVDVDYDTLPTFSRERQQPGRFCPVTGNPLDETAFRNFTYAFGNDESNRRLKLEHLDAINGIHKTLNLPAITLPEDSTAPLTDEQKAEVNRLVSAAMGNR